MKPYGNDLLHRWLCYGVLYLALGSHDLIAGNITVQNAGTVGVSGNDCVIWANGASKGGMGSGSIAAGTSRTDSFPTIGAGMSVYSTFWDATYGFRNSATVTADSNGDATLVVYPELANPPTTMWKSKICITNNSGFDQVYQAERSCGGAIAWDKTLVAPGQVHCFEYEDEDKCDWCVTSVTEKTSVGKNGLPDMVVANSFQVECVLTTDGSGAWTDNGSAPDGKSKGDGVRTSGLGSGGTNVVNNIYNFSGNTNVGLALESTLREGITLITSTEKQGSEAVVEAIISNTKKLLAQGGTNGQNANTFYVNNMNTEARLVQIRDALTNLTVTLNGASNQFGITTNIVNFPAVFTNYHESNYTAANIGGVLSDALSQGEGQAGAFTNSIGTIKGAWVENTSNLAIGDDDYDASLFDIVWGGTTYNLSPLSNALMVTLFAWVKLAFTVVLVLGYAKLILDRTIQVALQASIIAADSIPEQGFLKMCDWIASAPVRLGVSAALGLAVLTLLGLLPTLLSSEMVAQGLYASIDVFFGSSTNAYIKSGMYLCEQVFPVAKTITLAVGYVTFSLTAFSVFGWIVTASVAMRGAFKVAVLGLFLGSGVVEADVYVVRNHSGGNLNLREGDNDTTLMFFPQGESVFDSELWTEDEAASLANAYFTSSASSYPFPPPGTLSSVGMYWEITVGFHNPNVSNTLWGYTRQRVGLPGYFMFGGCAAIVLGVATTGLRLLKGVAKGGAPESL